MAESVKSRDSVIQILAICCKMEETCADLYRYFAKIYADTPQVSALWEKTAKEEDNHAEHFRLAFRLQGTGIQALKADMYRATTVLAKIQSIYESVQKSPPPIKEAFRFAIKLEESIADYHMDTIATFDDENLESLFSSMMKNDNDHVVMLGKAYKELCE